MPKHLQPHKQHRGGQYRRPKKFYAVRIGRGGPAVYDTWFKCRANVFRFSGAINKSFPTRRAAKAWVNAVTYSSGSHSLGKVDTITDAKSGNVCFKDEPGRIRKHVTIRQQLPIPPVAHPPTAFENGHFKGELRFIPLPPDHIIASKQLPQSPVALLPTTLENPCLMGEPDYIPLVPDLALDLEQTPLTIVEESPPLALSYHQQVVFDKVRRRENVFFSGSAGTGKSLLLREIIKYFGGKSSSSLAITASTGIAAINIGGVTLHSFAGVGLGKEPIKQLIRKVFGQKSLSHILTRWRFVRTLIIDEISMIDGIFFDKLVGACDFSSPSLDEPLIELLQEQLARTIRETDQPFGGIQLIICGDFCQLPPVPDTILNVQVPPIFAFEARSWDRCVGPPILLRKVFRQEDQKFVDILNDMRLGKLKTEVISKLKALKRTVIYIDGIRPTELFPVRSQVDSANTSRLNALPGQTLTYTARDMPGFDSNGEPIPEGKVERILDRLVANKEVKLKIGAQVMLVKNITQGVLVNGSLGQVIDFCTVEDALKKHAKIANDCNKEQLTETELEKQLVKKLGTRLWPFVRFINGTECLCIPTTFEQVNAIGRMEASRDQIPLILAWALSIHKSQGQTLERVKVDLGRIFEKGQAYVALSRATSMEGLEILNFDPSNNGPPHVLDWYADVERRQQEEEIWQILDEMKAPEATEAFFFCKTNMN